MPRLTPSGKRIVHRKPTFPVPPGLLATIDAQAVKVLQLRDDCADLRARVSRVNRQAFEAGFEADLASDPELRKILSDRANRLSGQASTLWAELDRAAQMLQEQESQLSGLHREAKAWRRGERAEGA